jgi:hypothetical protein
MDFSLEAFSQLLQSDNKKKTTLCPVCKEFTTHIELSRRDIVRIMDATTGKSPSGREIKDLDYTIAAILDLNFILNAFTGKFFLCSLCKHPSAQNGIISSKPDYKGYSIHVVNKHKFDISVCIHSYSEGNWRTSDIKYIEPNNGKVLIHSKDKVNGCNIYVHACDANGKVFQGKDVLENSEHSNRYYETIDGEKKEFSLVCMPEKFCSFAVKFISSSFK